MKILHVAAEGLPFIKTGGLADVIQALPKELAKSKNNVSVILPLYLKIAINNHKDFDYVCTFDVKSGIINTSASIFKQVVDNVTFYFIQHQYYFERESLYGYGDDGERFSFFSLAVLNMIRELKLKFDVVNLHDWHTGVIPLINRIYFKDLKLKYVYTIHNLAYQGVFPKELMHSCLSIDDTYYNNGLLKFNDNISFMKAGILCSDKVSTVSPTYANEILTKEFGENLDGVLELRRYDLAGILNGIDYEFYNPKTDPKIALNYGINDSKKGKKENKIALQEMLGLEKNPKVMMVSMITRLTNQKGLELIINKINDLISLNIQVAILGSGDSEYENIFKALEYNNKGKVVFYCGYNEDLAHQIYAGSDLLLMPSLFEPCGLSQMIAMKYGCLPLVRETGGLKDTVIPYNEYVDEGTGFTFTYFNDSDMFNTILYAYNVYYKQNNAYNRMVKRAMKTNYSFKESAKLYVGLYKEVKSKRGLNE